MDSSGWHRRLASEPVSESGCRASSLADFGSFPRGGVSDTQLPVTTSGRSVLLLGATGLVGSKCLRRLLADETVSRVVVLTRTPLANGSVSPKLDANVIDFEHLTAQDGYFALDQIIFALGTTIKQAGSRARFRAVDFLYPITAAHLGRERGASHFLLVSSAGANSSSGIFYNRTKGELEDALLALSYPAITIVRPSLLLGKRARPRLGERLAGALLLAAPARYRPIEASRVARALTDAARIDARGSTSSSLSILRAPRRPGNDSLRRSRHCLAAADLPSSAGFCTLRGAEPGRCKR